ncbi:MAG: leucine-rich repeat protein [Clostridia bacterium]|nr:leucine-rich repeat protein [Clostridia bacterium]
MKKRFLTVFILAMVMVLGVMSAVLTACSKEEEYPTWNVSAEGSDVTAYFTDNGKYGYILTVEGSGAMRDYSSAKDAPWYGKSGRVTELVIKDGITSIGDNAFTHCYYADTVMLPASVTTVGENAFPASSKVYGYATDISVGEGTTVYVYSESQPTVGGNFWHEVNGAPAVWPYVVTSPQKILFIGNSYTFYNDMPTLFKEIANGAGAEVTVESLTTGSQSLKNWADPKTEDGARVEAALTASSYDIIVLQEKSTSPVNDDYKYFLSGAKALAERIEETQDNCRIFLYETWGSPAYAGSYGGSVPEMESRLRTAYDTVAERIGATVSYVGKAFTYMYENYADINLYNTADENHPSYEGSYLAACVHAASLLGLNVENSEYNGALDQDTAALLRMVGYGIAVGADMPEISYDMQIAVYSRYADAKTIADLVAAFKEDYAAENGVEAPEIKYSLLGASNTGVAAFGNLVNSGNYDIVFATGNNINTEGGVSVIGKKSYSVVSTAYTGTRYISYLTENAIAVAFFNFMDTDAAKIILDPSYVPEEIKKITVNFVVDGKPYAKSVVLSSASTAGAQELPELPEKTGLTPMGWALTAEEQTGEVTFSGEVTYGALAAYAENGVVTLYARYINDDVTLINVNIAVFARYVDEDTIIKLVAAFGESYQVGEGERLNVTYEMLGNGSTGAGDFGALVNAGDFNITFGSGGNVDSTGGVTIIAKKSVYVAYYSGDRTVAYLTEDGATKAFYDFLDTDTAKKILNPDYVSDSEAQEITVNLIVKGSAYGEAIVISNATSATAKSLPKPEADAGYVFKGWATTQSEVAGETLIAAGAITYGQVSALASGGTLTLYARFDLDDGPVAVTITVGYYSNSSINDEKLTAIETAFKAYALEEGYDVEITFKSYTNMTTMNGDAAAGQIDYAINVGNAITEANGVAGTKVQPGSSSRYVMQIADTEIAALFHQFALQDETITGF